VEIKFCSSLIFEKLCHEEINEVQSLKCMNKSTVYSYTTICNTTVVTATTAIIILLLLCHS
jgi:hypothetical protein